MDSAELGFGRMRGKEAGTSSCVGRSIWDDFSAVRRPWAGPA